ncbi:hypothetical protein RKD20_005488 [Streptomyces sp. SLBN-8D4]
MTASRIARSTGPAPGAERPTRLTRGLERRPPCRLGRAGRNRAGQVGSVWVADRAASRRFRPSRVGSAEEGSQDELCRAFGDLVGGGADGDRFLAGAPGAFVEDGFDAS